MSNWNQPLDCKLFFCRAMDWLIWQTFHGSQDKYIYHGPAYIAFLCSPPLLFFSGCMRPFCQNMGVVVAQTRLPNGRPDTSTVTEQSTVDKRTPSLSQGRLVSNFMLFSQPTGVTSNKQLLIKAKVLSILIYCYYLLVRMSCMHLLSKFDLQIPPSYPLTTY